MGHLVEGSCALWSDDGVLEHTQISNLDLYHIPWFEKYLGTTGITHTAWSARRNDIPRLQRYDLGDVGKHGGNIKDKVARVRLLHHLTIEPQGDIEGVGVANFISGDQRRANGSRAKSEERRVGKECR